MALRCSQILLSMSPVAAAKSLASGIITPRFIRSTSLYRPSSTTSNHRSFPISNLSPGVAGAATSEKYVYPDPNPEFTEAEVVKFRGEILKRLANEKEEYGDSLNEVVNVCVQVLREFLLKEYGGPGTFVVEPFTFIMVSLKEKNLPGI